MLPLYIKGTRPSLQVAAGSLRMKYMPDNISTYVWPGPIHFGFGAEMILAIGVVVISSKWLAACLSLAHQLSSFAHIHHVVASGRVLYDLP
jgi:hypothetical protein